MKHKKTVACMLAALFCSVPFAACSAPDQEEATLPSEEIEITTPVEDPELPPVQEEPELPPEEEEPETPSVPVTPPAVPEEPKSEYIKVLVNALNVRKGAGTQYASLGTVQNGVLLKYIDKEGNWYKTYY